MAGLFVALCAGLSLAHLFGLSALPLNAAGVGLLAGVVGLSSTLSATDPLAELKLNDLEEKIIQRWRAEKERRTLEVAPDDFKQATFDGDGFSYTLKSSPAFDALSLAPPEAETCPACVAAQREVYVIQTVQLPSGRAWEIWVPRRSYEPYQIAILPIAHDGQPAQSMREQIADMLALKKRLPHFAIVLDAGATHFEGCFVGECLQVEKRIARGLWRQGNFWLAQVEGWPAECMKLRGQHDLLAAWVAQAIELSREQGLASHVLITGNAAYIVRRKQDQERPAIGALDVFDLRHVVSHSIFEWANANPQNVSPRLQSIYADLSCRHAETTTFVQALIARMNDGASAPLDLEGSPQAREATLLEILAGCVSGHAAVQTAAQARLQALIKDELAQRKAAVECAPEGGRKWSRYVNWAEPHLRPAEERIHDSDEVNLGLGLIDAFVEASRCLKCREPFCTQGCPVRLDIKGFIVAFVSGDIIGANAIVKKDNLLPTISSRVCPQETQCQRTCTLGKRGEALSIGLLERAVVEIFDTLCTCNVVHEGMCPDHTNFVAPEKDYPIAIIGTGPAGLTAAAELARMYTRIVVFEALPEPGGGVLKYGIPEFRLPKHIVKENVESVKRLGVNVIFDVAIGRTLTIADLRRMGFRAILLGTGAGLPKFMGIPGEDLNGVTTANEFLIRYNQLFAGRPGYDTPIKAGRKVVIIGGGNVAMDAARSALRAGAEEVMVMYRRSEEEMPVRAEEKDRAKEEGIVMMPLTAPLAFLGENGWLKGIRCQKMELGQPDASGRRSPVPIKGSEFVMQDVDTVILAIGTESNAMLMDQEGLPKGKYNNVALQNDQTGQTHHADIFAAGDVAGGSTVIEAMGGARRAVAGIHAYLQSLGEDAREISLDARLLQKERYVIRSKETLAKDIVMMKVYAPFVAAAARAGQFVMVMSDEKAERIPLTLADWDTETGEITLVLQAIGASTIKLSKRNVGECLFSVAGALGKPSDIPQEPQKDTVVCVAGGVGIAPIYPIAHANAQAGNKVVSIIGAKSREYLFWEEKMREVSESFTLTLDSEGKLVTDGLCAYLEEQKANGTLGRIARIVAIGSVGMMKAVSALTAPYGIPTVVSLNSIMLCGIGMCGCDRETVGKKLVFTCVHGPEFDSQLVDWPGVVARQRRYVDEEAKALAQMK
jgi:glutamate synthase (NADPH/NADH) small chain